MGMRDYNKDQWEALLMIEHHLEGLPASELERLRASATPYLEFRSEVSRFQREFLSEICTQTCFTTRQSACCNSDGIVTFFADVVTRWRYLLPSRISSHPTAGNAYLMVELKKAQPIRLIDWAGL